MVSILFRNIQYKYAETYKAVLFHEGKGVNKGCSQITVICPPPPPPAMPGEPLLSLSSTPAVFVGSLNSQPGQAAPQP